MAERPPDHEDEEEELHLPPLDGEEGEPARPLHDEEDDLTEGDAVSGDDAAGIDLDPGATLEALEDLGADDTEAAPDAVDVGAIADVVAFRDGDSAASDERGLELDEDETSPFDAALGGDAGAGTGEDPASFVDEGALPPLGADDGVEVPGAPAREVRFLNAPWERGRWRVASGMGARVPCWLVAVSSAHVVAAGPTVLVARGGARVTKSVGLDIDVAAIAASDDAVIAAARRGVLFASLDGGDTWTTGSVPWEPSRGTLAILATAGRFWVCEGGALWLLRWSERGRPEPPLPLRNEGVRAAAAAASTLVILAERGADLVIERLRGDDEAAGLEAIPKGTRAAIGDEPALLAAAAGGRMLAILAGGVAHLSRDAGRSFRPLAAPSAVAAAFAGDAEGARLLLLCATAERGREARLFLAEESPAGDFMRVAEVAAGAGRAAMAWDGAREVLWVASSVGLVAYERIVRH